MPSFVQGTRYCAIEFSLNTQSDIVCTLPRIADIDGDRAAVLTKICWGKREIR